MPDQDVPKRLFRRHGTDSQDFVSRFESGVAARDEQLAVADHAGNDGIRRKVELADRLPPTGRGLRETHLDKRSLAAVQLQQRDQLAKSDLLLDGLGGEMTWLIDGATPHALV